MNESVRLRAAIKQAGDDYLKIAEVIDAEKARRFAQDRSWRKKLTPKERTIWQVIDVIRNACTVEAKTARLLKTTARRSPRKAH